MTARTDQPDHAAALRRELVDVHTVLDQLGLKARREGAGFKVLCPWHDERTPSCMVRIGPDSTLQARCHGCGEGGDVLSLIAAVRGYAMPSRFRDVLLDAATLAGEWTIVDELEGRAHGASSSRPVRAERPPSRPPSPTLDGETYAAVAHALLELCPLRAQPDVCAYLEERRIYVDAEARGFGALPSKTYQGPVLEVLTARFGTETLALAGLLDDDGHGLRASAWRVLIPWRDRRGRVLSVQRRVLGKPPGEMPKYLFPKGRAMPSEPFGAELFDEAIGAMRASGQTPELAFTESALDALALTMLARRAGVPRAVLGIPSASTWRAAWAEYGRGLRVLIATDADPAGEKVAASMAIDLRKVRPCPLSLVRSRPITGKDWGDVAR